jgi:NAD(P)-dependent dehydrogenase (short-subunit alcohol dehydrogenase family)
LTAGAKVVTSARQKGGDEGHHELVFIQADLTTPEGCTKLVNETISRFCSGVDILVSVLGDYQHPVEVLAH